MAAGSRTKTVLVSLRADLGDFKKDFKNIAEELRKAESSFESFGNKATRYVAGLNSELKALITNLQKVNQLGLPLSPGGGQRPGRAPSGGGGGGVAPGGRGGGTGGAGGGGGTWAERYTPTFNKWGSSTLSMQGLNALGGSALGGAGMMAGGAALGFIISTAAQAVTAAEQYQRSQRYLPGMQGTTRNAGLGAMTGFGVNVTEAAAMRTQFGRQMGMGGFMGGKGPEYYSMLAGMGAGVEQGTAAGFMGMGRRGGITGIKQFKMMERVFETAIKKGTGEALDRALMTDYLQSVQQISEQQLGLLGVLSSRQITESAGLVDQLRRRTGLDVTQAGAIMGKMNAGIQRPGAGEAGQMFMLRAMGFGNPFQSKMGGGGNTYYEAMKKQEEGLNLDNFKSVMKQSDLEYGKGAEAQAMMLKEVFGVSLHQAEYLQKMWDEGKSQTEVEAEIKKIQDSNTTPLEEMGNFAKKNMGLAAATAGVYNALVDLGQTMAPFVEWLKGAQVKAISMQMMATKLLMDEFGGKGSMLEQVEKWRTSDDPTLKFLGDVASPKGNIGKALSVVGQGMIGGFVAPKQTPGGKVVGAVTGALGERADDPYTGSAFREKAIGGPVSGSSSYIVGERGPEVLHTGRSGRVEPTTVSGTQLASLGQKLDNIAAILGQIRSDNNNQAGYLPPIQVTRKEA